MSDKADDTLHSRLFIAEKERVHEVIVDLVDRSFLILMHGGQIVFVR